MKRQPGIGIDCPLCPNKMCGCSDCLDRKKFRVCKPCGQLFRSKFGRYPQASEVRAARGKLAASGLWNEAQKRRLVAA